MAVLPDYNSILSQSQQQQSAAIQPQLQSLESQKPNLKQQYDTALGQIKDQQASEIGRTQTASSREFGKRGIPLSSGVFDQSLNEQLSPINRYYTGQMGQADVNYNNNLNSLAQQIAGLQSGANQNAISAAQGLYSSQLGAYENERNRNHASSLQSQALAAQARGNREATALLDQKQRQAYLGGATNYLTGAFANNTNSTVDANELNYAYQYLTSQGLSKADATGIIRDAFKQQQLKPYQLDQRTLAELGVSR